MKLLLATRNRDKVRELKAILAGLPLELISAADMPGLPEVEEDAETLEGNAIKKARTLFELTGIPAMADDTGLEIDALDGAPGVYSSRYSGPDATYRDNVEKVLRELQNVPEAQRTARFRTVVAFVSETETKTVEGICHGRIAAEPRGSGTFGYDPIFEVTGTGKTMAEMTLEEKNRISHRGRAMAQFVEFIKHKTEAGT